MGELEERLARHTRKFVDRPMTPDELQVIKRSVADSYAGICASLADTSILHKFSEVVTGPGAGSETPVWGVGQESSITDAVFLNAILARRSDLLNTYVSPTAMGVVHPSDNVALALVLGDWLKWTGKQFLASVNVLFNLSARFADSYDPEIKGFDHDAAATFWVALAAGQALGLSEAKLVEAQRIAGEFGFTSNQAAVGHVTDWKHCTYASGAMRGLQAARLALAGFTGPASIYQGDFGADRFYRSGGMSFDAEPDLRTIIFKRWPALFYCQTPIDVARELSSRIGDVTDIRQVKVETYDRALRNGATPSADNPTSRAGRTHSIAYCVATALLKPVEYADFDADRARDPQLRRLLGRISVAEDSAMTKKFPSCTPCRISITLEDGEVIRQGRDYSRGDPRDPLSDDEISDKVRRNLKGLTSPSNEEEIISGLWNAERLDGLAVLQAPLQQNRTRRGARE
ncbi:MmgE/PrpD family protein [Salinispora tropica]|uniref:MmgE/PrpD family protein n=1 Tax=Salinispora tropica TaxID=168695 RepID=UPI00048EF79F|nr:MmgE/PrpD family protein [Salinispora tropica]